MTEPMKTAEFAKLKYQVGELLRRKFLEYNDGKFYTAIEFNPATHALTEFVEQQVLAERERIIEKMKARVRDDFDLSRVTTLQDLYDLIREA